MKKLLVASLLALGAVTSSANAALFELVGTSSFDLPDTFNPSEVPGFSVGAVPTAADLNPVQLADAAGEGLRLLSDANLTFTFLGKEAGFTNVLFAGADLMTNVSGTNPQTLSGVAASALGGFLNFGFKSNGSEVIQNGSVLSPLGNIAFKLSADGNSVFVLLNDLGPNSSDWDDMVIRIDAEAVKDSGGNEVPLPAGAVLLLSGIAGLGVMGRNRKKA